MRQHASFARFSKSRDFRVFQHNPPEGASRKSNNNDACSTQKPTSLATLTVSKKCGGRSKPPFLKVPHSGSLRNLPLRHPASVRDPVAGMHDDLLPGGEAGQNLGDTIIPMTY